MIDMGDHYNLTPKCLVKLIEDSFLAGFSTGFSYKNTYFDFVDINKFSKDYLERLGLQDE